MNPGNGAYNHGRYTYKKYLWLWALLLFDCVHLLLSKFLENGVQNQNHSKMRVKSRRKVEVKNNKSDKKEGSKTPRIPGSTLLHIGRTPIGFVLGNH